MINQKTKQKIYDLENFVDKNILLITKRTQKTVLILNTPYGIFKTNTPFRIEPQGIDYDEIDKNYLFCKICNEEIYTRLTEFNPESDKEALSAVLTHVKTHHLKEN